MSTQNLSSNNQFINLNEYTISEESPVQFQSNVIKNLTVEAAKFNSLQIESNCVDEPTVVVRRNGDSIESIEFTCSCGNKKIVKFEYEGE